MSINQAFEHFVQTGEIDAIFPPKGDVDMPKLTPYFTYEVGIDEPPHPSMDIAQRFVEVAMSDCKYGCKIYADPYSEVRVLVHSAVYGCNKTMQALELDREDGKIRPGDTVEFGTFNDPLIVNTGKVLNYLEPDEHGFKGGYHIGCYYVVPAEHVRASSPGETYQQGYDRLHREGRTDAQIAAYFGITLEKLKSMNLAKHPEPFEGNEYKAYEWVRFRLPDDSEQTYTGQVMRYISPTEEPEDHPYGGYHVAVNSSFGTEYAMITDKAQIVSIEK